MDSHPGNDYNYIFSQTPKNNQTLTNFAVFRRKMTWTNLFFKTDCYRNSHNRNKDNK